jgi:hypothetical protein
LVSLFAAVVAEGDKAREQHKGRYQRHLRNADGDRGSSLLEPVIEIGANGALAETWVLDSMI